MNHIYRVNIKGSPTYSCEWEIGGSGANGGLWDMEAEGDGRLHRGLSVKVALGGSGRWGRDKGGGGGCSEVRRVCF